VNLYPFIEAEKTQQRNVKRACELLEVSRAAFYTDRVSVRSARQVADEQLTEHIRQAHQTSKGRYGAPPSTPSWPVGAPARPQADRPPDARRRAARAHPAPLHAHHHPRPGRCPAWRPDLSRLRRGRRRGQHPLVRRHHLRPDLEGWLYLATVIDIASRRVVGFALADHLRTGLVADALTNAVAARDPGAGVIFHADRGCQYTSGDYAVLASDLEVRLSSGRTGQCWDNALAESFFASLKGECLDLQPWPTRAAARRATVDYIAWYNGTRLHSALGYQTPDEFESTTRKKVTAQAA
jgi:putative transposase